MEIPEFQDPEHRLLAVMVGSIGDKQDDTNGAVAANTKFRVQAQAIICVVSGLALAWGGLAIMLLAGR